MFGVDKVSNDPLISYAWPQNSITAQYPPTYLSAGTADQAVPYQESVHIAHELEKNGIKHVLNLVEGKDHLLDQQKDDKDVNATRKEILEFIGTYIG